MIKNKKVTIRLSENDLKRAKILVAERGITLSEFFLNALEEAEIEHITPEFEAYLEKLDNELENEIRKGKKPDIRSIDDIDNI